MQESMDFSSPDSGFSFLELLAGFGTLGIIITLAILLLMIIAGWKIFTKAGKPGWASIIPIYNVIVLCEIVGKPAWWVILTIIPIVGTVVGIWLLNLMYKSFGKGAGWTIGTLFFPFIFLPMLGFGSATYQGPAASQGSVQVA